MVMRVGGLASGMDIDALVEKLMQAEKAPLNKLLQNKTRYEWQRDAYRGVNTKLKTFDTYIADNLVLKTFNSKTASSSNSSLVSAVATGKASGTLTIESVSQLATAARGIGEQTNFKSDTKLSDALDGSVPASISIQSVDKQGNLIDPVKIDLTSDMTVDDLMSKINSSGSGVSAIFENGRLSITAKNTGKAAEGTSIKLDTDGANVFTKLGLKEADIKEGTNAKFEVNGIATERSSNSFNINGYNVTLNSTFNEMSGHSNRVKAAQISKDIAETAITKKFEDLKTKYGIDTTGKTLDEINTEFTAKFAELATDYAEKLNTSKENYLNAYNKKISGTTAGAIFDNLTTDAKNFLKNVSLGANEKLTDEHFDGTTLSDADKTALLELNISGSDIAKINAIDEKKAAQIEAETALQTASSESIGNGSDTAGNVFSGLSEEAKNLLSNMPAGGKFTSEMFDDTFDTNEIDRLVALSSDDVSKLKDVQTKTAEKATADAAVTAAVDADINKVTAGQALDGLSADAQKFLKDNSTIDDATIDGSSLSDDEKALLKTYTASQLTDLKAVQTTQEIFSADNAKLQDLNKDMNEVVSAYTTYEEAEKTLNDIKNETPPAEETKSSAVTLTSTTNVDEMMTKIKDFVNTYNGLVKDLKNQTSETKYRDYAPLTDEQKKDMKENEIKLWEEKAKSGLLRNDALISSGLSDMRSLVYQSNPAIEDSKFNTLYSIGITSSKNYNEGGTLEIDEDKLRKAIEENPDAVEKLFKNSDGKKEDTIQVTDPVTGNVMTKTVDSRGYIDKLRESMKNFEISIEKKAGRSTMTDGQYAIGKSILDTDKRISTWQDKLKNIEARYWKQFSAMEQAINKANSQSSMFMQGQ
ncbi:flagellar filament capping protein FliD [Solibacillus sp. MA9]|uniref:Flagellar hook-associated protein 2 n=1 Tax=Solibacillus palustris TaxID=2908203 RepID=A0ABS9U8K5_9BACL|nr:flagellar filament capping protein FliD [Solibacillus sp. MA9]MCH7320656.1 flagellar filament capping protein FliD [Solibacillus sp. MA9]